MCARPKKTTVLAVVAGAVWTEMGADVCGYVGRS